MAEKEVIVLSGIKETIDALKEFDKDAVKRFNNVINSELSKAETSARSVVARINNSQGTGTPMSGWKQSDTTRTSSTRGGAGWPGFKPSEVAAGIVKSKAQGRVRGNYTTSAGKLINKSAAGAIFEVAGRNAKPSAARTSSAQFLRTLSNRFGRASRLIWSVVDKEGEQIQRNVAKALEEAKQDLQRALNKGKD
jgi:hypothetical protein